MKPTLIHPGTKKQAALFLKKPSMSLLLTGDSGNGKSRLAKSLAVDILKIDNDLGDYPYFLLVQRPKDKKEISIDTVREINRFLKLKTPGKDGVRRVVMIENAGDMSTEAQNALLKMLEEPNSDTLFILTAAHRSSLLPTIVSRCQVLDVHPVGLKQAEDFYEPKFGSKKTEAAWRLSGGGAVLMESLLESKDHELAKGVQSAKDFLSINRYERLLYLDKLSKDKQQYEQFLWALGKVLAALQSPSLARSKFAQSDNLVADRRTISKSLDALANNVSVKLITLNLLLNLRH